MARVGEAVVRLVADARGLDDSVDRQVRRAANRASKSLADSFDRANTSINRSMRSASKSVDSAVSRSSRQLTSFSTRVRQSFVSVSESVRTAFQRTENDTRSGVRRISDGFLALEGSIGSAFRNGFTRARSSITDFGSESDGTLRRLGASFSGFAASVGQAVSGGLSAAASSIQGSLTSLVQNVNPAGLLLVAGAIAAIGSAMLLVGGLSTQLIGLIGPLPGILASLGVVGGVVAIAFSRVGDAFGAALSGNVKKFNESIKELSPAARQVAIEFRDNLAPAIQSIRASVEQGFFAPLVGELGQLKPLVEVFRTGLSGVASSLGRAAAGMLEFLSQPDQLKNFETLFGNVSDIVDTLSPSVTQLAGSLLGLFTKSGPATDTFAEKLSGLINQFSLWLEDLTPEDISDFFDKALEALGAVSDLIVEVGRVSATLFGDSSTQEGSLGFLEDVTSAFELLNDALKSPEGQTFIDALAVGLRIVGAIIAGAITDFALFGLIVGATINGAIGIFQLLNLVFQNFINFITGVAIAAFVTLKAV